MKKDKHYIFAALLLLLAASAAPSLAAYTHQISHLVQYSAMPEVSTDTLDGVAYSTLGYGDLYNGGQTGAPSLPIDYLKFSVPYNATNFTVSVTSRWSSSQNLDHLLFPCQAPWMPDGSSAPPVTLPDSAAYNTGSFYPAQMAWVVDEGFLAGENHIVTVALMPFRYRHTASSDVYSKVNRCTVSLHYELSDSLSMWPIVRKDSLLREEGYELAQTMVVNPNQVKTFAPSYSITPGIGDVGIIQGGIGGNEINGGGYVGPQPIDSLFPPPGADTTGFGTELQLVDVNYPYLIVTTPELKHSVRRIAALKQQKGYNVKVVTMDEVMNSPFAYHGDSINGHIAYSDSAGVLRQFLRTYYAALGTKYVLLVGDLPYRILPGSAFDYLTDVYFSDLSANWQDMASTDRNPELYVGRIVANHQGADHVEQIDNYIEKLFRYELNPGNGDYTYLRQALFSQGRLFKGSFPDVKANLSQIYPNPVSIDDNVFNYNLHPNGKDIIDTINSNPVGFVSIFNHSDTTRTRIYGEDRNGYMSFIHATSPITDGDGLNCLRNKYYPFIFYSPACVTIPFDNKRRLTFGESFITGKDYGGPVYMGYTRSVFRIDAKSLAEAFSRRVKDGYVKLGIAFSMAKTDVVYDSVYTRLIQGYFGDPELELWTDIPQCFTGINIIRSNNLIIISGMPAGSTAVGYLSKDNGFKTKIVTNSSTTLNDASSNSPIMMYQHNYIPYIAPLKLQNFNSYGSQYVIAGDVTAGYSIDNSRDCGEVRIKSGAEYEIEATGTVTLEDGFKVEKGATFAVYPSCF